jgi:hypothetical protein
MMEARKRGGRWAPLLGASALAATVLFAAAARAQEGRTTDDQRADAMFAASAKTRDFTKTSTKPQNDSGGNFVPADGAQITVPDNPFSFTRTSRIATINRVTITATITDGDTGVGETERNDLLLVLDGVNTGIELNGYRHGLQDTRTNSGVPINKRELRNKLRQDGELHATIKDRDPGPNQDVILPANFETTLTIKGEIRR